MLPSTFQPRRSLIIVALSAVVAGILPGVLLAGAGPAGAATSFKLPFRCGETWKASTYSGHSSNSVDWNRSGEDRGYPVLASGAGTFRLGSSSNGEVVIDHGGGWKTFYAHMTGIPTSLNGKRVASGTQIGKVGAVGNATAPHLHYAQLYNGVRQRVSIDGRAISYSGSYKSTNKCSSTPAPKPTKFSGSVSSKLWVTSNGQEVRLKVCANNLPGQTVKVDFRRPATAGYGARSWTYSKKASSKCVEFADMEGSGAVFRGVTYTSRAALNSTPSTSWSGAGCFTATGGRGLCDQVRR